MTLVLPLAQRIKISNQLRILRPDTCVFSEPPTAIMDVIGLPTDTAWADVGTCSCRRDSVGLGKAVPGIPYGAGIDYVLSIPLGLTFIVQANQRVLSSNGEKYEVISTPDPSYQFEQSVLCKLIPAGSEV